MRRFFLISIFLCTISSISFGSTREWLIRADALMGAGQWGVAAAVFERALWDNPTPEESIVAILGKSECYSKEGKNKEAYETLKRAPMFGLSERDRKALTISKLCYGYLSGQYEEFEAQLSEAMSLGIIPEMESNTIQTILSNTKLRQRSEIAAMLLSIIPGCGHFYSGEPLKGVEHLVCELLVIGVATYSIISGLYFTGIGGGAMSLAPLKVSAAEESMEAVAGFNAHAKKEYYLQIYSILSSLQ
ncbi:MAG: tetratricopeptide repeat protein [Bacteroidales bacterium]|nr:tetratricopeptide repeat protein [Bacteroidales bacterium]